MYSINSYFRPRVNYQRFHIYIFNRHRVLCNVVVLLPLPFCRSDLTVLWYHPRCLDLPRFHFELSQQNGEYCSGGLQFKNNFVFIVLALF